MKAPIAAARNGQAEEGSAVATVTLSFDNGPVAGATEPLLDLLARHDIRTTFFLVGERLSDPAARRAAERAKAEGHVIGNHTMTHSAPLGTLGPQRSVWEIEAAEQALGPLAADPPLFRPMGGGGALGRHLVSPAAAGHLTANGYTMVTWTSVPGDFREPHRAWVDKAIADTAAEAWSVVVLHDEHIATMLDTLEHLLGVLAERGDRIVQAFPPSCLPIEAGRTTAAFEAISP